MASSPSNPPSEPAMIEQVITEFFAKSLHIILESRSPYVSSRNYSGDHLTSSPSSSSSSSSVRPRDRWFNLALRDCPAALENFDLWPQSNLDPVVIDIILTRRPPAPEWVHRPPGGCLLRTFSAKDRLSTCCSPGHDEFLPETKSEKIVERWVVQYEARKSGSIPREMNSSGKKSGGGATSHSPETLAMYKKIYNRSTILLRSLYVMVRLLPAYKFFRDLNSSGQLRPFSLTHRISSFAEPFTRTEDAKMTQFSFTPVETPCGRLCLSVSYLPTLEDVSSEPLTPLSTQFIPDYVGSPTTDPLKRFQSLPTAGSLPAYISFARRHSWSNDHGATSSASPSPSPTYSDSRTLHYNRNSNLPPRSHPQDNSPSGCSVPQNPSTAHKKNMSFDEYWPSPPFSPSSSPSPPTHLLGGHLANALLRTESAPVNIPIPRPGRSSGNQALRPSPSPKGTRHGNSCQVDNLRAQAASASRTSSPESRIQLKKEPLKLGDLQTGMVLQKVLSFGKDEVGSFPGLKLSSTFSRSSSRLSLRDEFDDSEFVCPFAPDDEDVLDSCNRVESLDDKGQPAEHLESGRLMAVQKSQNAAVGAFIKMFKTAPPLLQDFSSSVRSLQAPKQEPFNQTTEQSHATEVAVGSLPRVASRSEMSASGLSKSRTAADALEELRTYQVMKESLLKQGGSQLLDEGCKAKSPGRGSLEI